MDTTGASPSNSGFADTNAVYAGQRLLFSEDQSQATSAFLNIGNRALWQTVKSALIKGFVLATVVTPVCFFIIIAGDLEGGTVLLAYLLWTAAWGIPWFIPDHVYGGHWELLLEDQAAVTEAAFVSIFEHLARKRSPAVIRPSQLVSVIGGPPRYYLTARQGRYIAYISAFPYGTDLFLSWTLWREQMPIAMIWYWIAERVSALVGKGSTLHQIVRTDPARAMREAVHNATRAGAEAAVAGSQVTILGTFGTTLATERIDDRVAMANFSAPPVPHGTPTPSSPPPVPPSPSAQPPAPPPPTGVSDDSISED